MSKTHFALIVAGGKGVRMGGELPKQFLPIGIGKPVLMYTIEAFYTYNADIRIILVLPASQQQLWDELCKEYNFTIPHLRVDGGETRFHSVKNALEYVEEGALVGVHDGVRPFVSQNVIANCFSLAEVHNAVIPVIDIVETIREVKHTDGNISTTVDRNRYKLVQTPQTFDSTLLKQAYRQEYTKMFTDDASVVEAMGIPVHLTEGNRENIKITTPFDLKIAAALLECSI